MLDVVAGEWGRFLGGFGREHRAWLATIHVVDANGAVTRSSPLRLKAATGSVDVVQFEFFDDAHSLGVRCPGALRVQHTDVGAVQALEIDTLDGQFIRLAFRATARPEQLDGLAPGESSFSERSTEPTATLTAAARPAAQNES